MGYNPFFGFYQNTISAYQPLINAKYFDGSGKSSLSNGAGWASLLRWQKSLIDYYGHKNLVKWNAGAGDEFSASHAFERGKLAMMVDGEWRVSFIGAEHPELKYGTAPMPVAEGSKSKYGCGLHQRDDHRHPEEREEQGRLVGARQVPDHQRPRAGDVLERHSQRAVDEELLAVEGVES